MGGIPLLEDGMAGEDAGRSRRLVTVAGQAHSVGAVRRSPAATKKTTTSRSINNGQKIN